MKTTIYELLGMIKDNKAPKKIMFKGTTWEYKEDEKDYSNKEWNEWLFDVYLITEILNDYIEILETTITMKQDKKIEKLVLNKGGNLIDEDRMLHILPPSVTIIVNKINEIIEVINERQD